jgi:predicted dehydrogenase
VNMLVVGNGNMGANHVRVLRALGHDVQTLDPAASAHADHRMICFGLINWAETVCVATPIDQLAQTAEAWLKRGKDVLVEKPGATDVATLAYLHQLAIEQGVQLQIGYTERHNPAVDVLRLSLPMVGATRHVSIRRLGYADTSVDPALNLACHDLDILDALDLGPRITNVERQHGHLVAHLVAHVAGWLEDLDITIAIEASHLHPIKRRTLEVVGRDGVLYLDYQLKTLSFVTRDGELTYLPVDKTESLVNEWQAFMRGEGSSGTAALALAEQMVEEPSMSVAA